jgi:tetratricopeptide (TPR) repeat protein
MAINSQHIPTDQIHHSSQRRPHQHPRKNTIDRSIETMDDRIGILAELSNEGGSYISTGRFNEAIDILQTAMKMAMKTSNSSAARRHLGMDLNEDEGDDSKKSQNDDCGDSTENFEEEEARLRISQVRQNVARDASSSDNGSMRKNQNHRACSGLGYSPPHVDISSGGDDDSEGDNDEFVYRKPIRVIDRYNPPNTSEMLLIIVFNMALGYHLKALLLLDQQQQKRQRRDRFFHAALKLYELAHSMETEQGIEISTSHSIAILNNVAHVYKLLRHYDKSKELLLRMLTTLAYVVDNGASSEVDHMDGFVQNVLHLILKDAHVARAA